jgi:peptidoglycan/xylan/chitin deacetylase (PgdA/CDA1 family)
MLTWNELKYLAANGVEIGAHTVTHPFLTELDHEAAWREISQCKHELEQQVGVEIRAFSYPNSRHNAEIREMVRQAGYAFAFGGSAALNARPVDRYNLARPCVYNRCGAAEFVFSLGTGLHLRQRYWDWRKQRSQRQA